MDIKPFDKNTQENVVDQLQRPLQRPFAKTLAVCAVAGSMLFTGTAMAATINVDAGANIADETDPGVDDCSLTEAIVNANNNMATNDDCEAGAAGIDTIVLPSGESIVLTMPFAASNGFPPITSEILIEGNGSTVSRDAGAVGEFRIFSIETGDGNLEIKDLTISGGLLTDMSGAGISCDDAAPDLVLDNVTVTGNEAKGTGQGGGISTGCFTDIINGSSITNNKAGTNGGGIHIAGSGDLVMRNSSISNNEAGEDGGGIYAQDSGDVDIEESTITGNKAVEVGGGIYTDRTAVAIVRSTVSNNTVTNSAAPALAGGVSVLDSNLDIAFSQIINNSATGDHARAGGVLFTAQDATYNLTVDNSLINGNSATDNGSTDTDLEDSNGGGVGITEFMTDGNAIAFITNSVISNNSTSGMGGGIVTNDGVVLNIEESIIRNNNARRGGGISMATDEMAPSSIERSRIINNTASQNGGGIYSNGANLAISYSTLSGNTATTDGGGIAAIYNTAETTSSTVTITRSTIAKNTASGNGGGIANKDSTVSLITSTVSGNSAAKGGGIFTMADVVPGTTTAITDSTVALNSATTNTAGGLDQLAGGTTTVAGTLLVDNDPQNCDPTNVLEGTWTFAPTVNLASDHSCDDHADEDIESPDVGGALLGALDDNGGVTSTHSLAVASAARNTDHSSATPDQRDITRPVGTGRDTGAFEAGGTLLRIESNNPPSVTVADNEDALLLDLNLTAEAGNIEVDELTAVFSGGGSPADVDSWKVFIDTNNNGLFTDEAPLGFDAAPDTSSETAVVFDLMAGALAIPDASTVRVLITATFDGDIDLAGLAPTIAWTQSANASVGQTAAAFGLASKLTLLMAALFLIALPFSNRGAKFTRTLILASFLTVGMTACSDDDDDDETASTGGGGGGGGDTNSGQVVNTNPPVVSGNDVINPNVFRLTLTEVTTTTNTASTGLPVNGAKITVNDTP